MYNLTRDHPENRSVADDGLDWILFSEKLFLFDGHGIVGCRGGAEGAKVLDGVVVVVVHFVVVDGRDVIGGQID